jgi:hypothetical protein
VSEGKKFDQEKPRFELVDLQDVEEEAIVMGIGAKKYDDYNYRLVPNAIGRYYSALQRHIKAWCNGEFLDKETGISHMIHVRCNAAILKWFEQNKPEMVKKWIENRKGKKI